MKKIEVKIDHPKTGKVLYEFEFDQYDSIEEMDASTYVNWCALINQGYEEAELRLRAFLLFSRVDLVKFAIKCPTVDPLELLAQLRSLIDSLLKQQIITKDLFTKCKIKLFNKLVGPGDYMSNLTYRQFGISDHYFMLYHNNGNEEDLNQFCGAIFTYGKVFDSIVADEIAEHFCKVPLVFKRAVLQNYWGLRNWQKLNFPGAFIGEEKNSKTKSKSKELVLTDWDAIAINIAEAGVFGYKKIVDESPINDVLKFIHDKKVQSKKSK